MAVMKITGVSMKKPSINEIYDFLNEVSGLVVHFSGCPKGVGPGIDLYPYDLIKIIKGQMTGGISCSLIIPGDNFSVDGNATGAIGVIVGFDEDGLVAVSSKDCGSRTDGNHIRYSEGKDINMEDLGSSLTDRQTYNEWIIKQNKIHGIFVFDAIENPVTGNIQIEGEDYLGYVYITLDEVKNTFKGMEIYTFLDEKIARLDRNSGHFIVVTQKELYR